MEAIAIDPADLERVEPAADGAACSLGMLHTQQAALEAARRLYRCNRSGLRFFCENRRVVPVDQLDPLGEFGEFGFGADAAGAAEARSTM